MIRIPLIIGLAIAMISCDSEITKQESHRSPNGLREITVIEELQGSNDDAPWWTHISLAMPKDGSRRIPGNLIKLEGRGAIAVDWNSDTEVSVFIDEPLFTQITSPSSTQDGIRISYRKVSQRTKFQSEQAAPSNR